METIPTRYAQALLSLALEQNNVEEYLQQAKVIYQSLNENPEFIKLLDSAFLNQSEKEEIIDQAFKIVDIEYLKTFIKVICSNNRAYRLIYIFREFIKMANNSIGIKSGIIYSATKLDKQEISNVESALKKKLSYKIELENKVDPSIIGGIKVILDNKVYDGSIQGRILSLKQELKGGTN